MRGGDGYSVFTRAKVIVAPENGPDLVAAVVKAVAEITGRNFILDPRVKGNITLYSEQAMTPRTRRGRPSEGSTTADADDETARETAGATDDTAGVEEPVR